MNFDLTCKVPRDADGMTVKGVLRREAGVSRRLMRSIVGRVGENSGGVYVNGEAAAFIDRVRADDEIGLIYPEESTHIEPENISLDILYEDDDLLAINKRAGIVAHPTKGHPFGTIANGVVAHMMERGEEYRPRFINRLDMDTSGVLLLGKNSHAQNSFTAQAARGDTVKKYLVAVRGILKNREGVINFPIGREGEGSPRRVVRDDGAPSVTRYRTLSTDEVDGFTFSVLEVVIDTGRTHQIRVHLAHIGHPVLGDTLYGAEYSDGAKVDDGATEKRVESDPPRQALHAHSLEFTHPRTGERITITAPIPGDISAWFTSEENRGVTEYF
jgi:23S rRNA pseudouridine1911/1915/1917 synthase